ncbi:cadherin-related family member 5 [Hoplias malabaricus]|uniref:cadherin-related family member 5 n=1 Tax=Hoplias malabaricus TaxID=27720 RepID=UPI00346283DE
MDLKHLDFSVKTLLCLLTVFSVNTFGQLCQVGQDVIIFKENNTVGATVTAITFLQMDVTLSITDNPNESFGINTNLLVANKVLDYEALIDPTLRVGLQCVKGGETQNLHVFVVVENINDNPPKFAQENYFLELPELSEVGTSVGRIEATDLDKDRLYYQLNAPMNVFGLKSDIDPEIQVKTVLDYDTTQQVNMVLFVQDTPLSSMETPSHTASTSITVKIIDINNRPPWFQPCTESTLGITKICLNSGYQGTVRLNQLETEALPLKPGPVHAIDGDKGRNQTILYTILEGNKNNTFSIHASTGAITMQKPVDVAGTITLTVMAYESDTPDFFATTTVTMQVVTSSLHPPKFVKSKYEGFISEDSGVGSLVLESKTSNKPLRVEATDADFADGVNPDIRFEIKGNSLFRITPEGFILTTSAILTGMVEMELQVIDKSNDESDTTSLAVEITPGVPTTTTEMPITTIPTTTITTDMITSTAVTTDMATDTSITTDDFTQLTTNPETVTSSPSTIPSAQTGTSGGDYKAEDMAALGASLAVVLLLCLVIIGLLVYRLKRNDADWKKLSEASIFRSMLNGGSPGTKAGVQYTNEGFQSDDDLCSVSSKQAAELPLPLGPGLSRSVPVQPDKDDSPSGLQSRTSNENNSPLADSRSHSSSDSIDGEKEVKPILTKERRVEDGYKAVWFKQDIDPSVKEEVVIIPDSEVTDINHDDNEDENDDDDDYDDDDDEGEADEERVRHSDMSVGSKNDETDL